MFTLAPPQHLERLIRVHFHRIITGWTVEIIPKVL